MTLEATAETTRSYLDAFLARGNFADYYTDEVTWTTVGADQELQGRQPVRDFLIWMHTQAFDAHPKVKTLVVGDGQAALEADFVGTHTGEFLGIPATGRSVQVPYCVVYDRQGDKITALRAYIPMDLFAHQLKSPSLPGPFHDIADLGSGDPCS
jgi:predicted ester cyclase